MNTNANEAAVATRDQFLSEVNPLDSMQVAAIANGEVLPFDMAANYWSPTEKGEKKRLIFQKIVTEPCPSFTDPTVMVDLEVAHFVEVVLDKETGEVTQNMVRTASKMIVSFLKTFNGGVPKHAAMLIEYKGREKGKRYMYDNWAIRPIIQNVQIVEPENN